MRSLFVVGWIGLVSPALAGSDAAVLCDSDGARFEILTPDRPSAQEQAAAQELRAYLKRICGADSIMRYI